ncbi:hypothetical protein CEXT_803891 [Caerostris extrusa]|uniref:Uncharacterized protein n=1 Tax=Caerostris extrusa TaxID=172846 RepID=A0AAV4Y3M6_CAEEX|nr:hypothetical protein CEXT_803891 [Caerostris extrusa]
MATASRWPPARRTMARRELSPNREAIVTQARINGLLLWAPAMGNGLHLIQSFEKAWERRDTLHRRKQSATLLTTLFRRFLDFLGGTRTFSQGPAVHSGAEVTAGVYILNFNGIISAFPRTEVINSVMCVDIRIRIVWVAFRFDEIPSLGTCKEMDPTWDNLCFFFSPHRSNSVMRANSFIHSLMALVRFSSLVKNRQHTISMGSSLPFIKFKACYLGWTTTIHTILAVFEHYVG